MTLLHPTVVQTLCRQFPALARSCPGTCRHFEIMTSPHWEDRVIVRWVASHPQPEHPQRIVQRFRYRCFDRQGADLHCSLFYPDAEAAQAFYDSLVSHHHQVFANS